MRIGSDVLSTIGAIVIVDGGMIDSRVWIVRYQGAEPEYYGECTRGLGNEIICHVGPYTTPHDALVHAVAEALSGPDPRPI